MAINDLFEMTIDITFFGNTFNNRFYYLGASAGSDAQGLAEAWDAFNASNWAAALHTSATLSGISVRNLSNLSDVGSLVTAFAGGRAGQVLSSFYGVTFALGAVSPLIRIGRKFLSPISETDINGSVIEVGYQPVLDQIETDLLQTITDLDTNQYLPAMFSPATLDRPFDVISSLGTAVYKRISTQNSRKGF